MVACKASPGRTFLECDKFTGTKVKNISKVSGQITQKAEGVEVDGKPGNKTASRPGAMPLSPSIGAVRMEGQT